VPTPNVSVVDLKFIAKRDTSVEEINAAIRAAADGPLKGVLGYTDEPLVSIDFNHDPHSSIFHMDQTKVMDGNMCRILTWYDNEWGFSNRMADTAVAMAKLIFQSAGRALRGTLAVALPSHRFACRGRWAGHRLLQQQGRLHAGLDRPGNHPV
jgi:hypothetical protein